MNTPKLPKMKNLLFILTAMVLLVLPACQPQEVEEEVEETTAAPDYALFDERVAVIRSFIQAHCDEDLDAQSAILADTLHWSPPHYNGNQWLGKEDYLPQLKSYHEGFENIQFAEGIVMEDNTGNGMWAGSAFPEATATSLPVAIRIYGTWTATHTESGKEIGVKWFGIAFMTNDNKIGRFTEYFDVGGLAAQIAAE